MVTKKESLERLGAVPLFGDMTNAQLGRLFQITSVIRHEPGHTIISEGETGAGFQLILEGSARVVRGGRTVARLGPGDFFGEMALIDGGPRSATVTADSQLVTLGIPSWDFRALVKTRPEMAWKLLVHLTGRLRDSQRKEDALRA